jgi:MFS family permease
MGHRIFPGWWVVVGAGCGVAFGSVVFMGTGFALVSGVMARQFNWSQFEAVQAATYFLIALTLSWPVVGWLLDRYGTRLVAASAIIFFACGLILLSFADNLSQYYLAFALIGLLSGATNAISYARAISLWFERRRGLALGLATSVQGVGAALIPLVLQVVLAEGNWPLALRVLALVQLFFCLPIVWFLVKDSPAPYGLRADNMAPTDDASDSDTAIGPPLSVIVRTRVFFALCLCFWVAGTTGFAINTNMGYILQPLLAIQPHAMAPILAAGGFTVIFGRLIFGYMLDHLPPALVAAGIFLLVICQVSLLAFAQDFWLLVLAAILGGLTAGGESDLMPYLAGYYFGKRSLAKVLGLFFFAWFFGAAAGPVGFAALSGAAGSVQFPLIGLGFLQSLPVIAFILLHLRHRGAGRHQGL